MNPRKMTLFLPFVLALFATLFWLRTVPATSSVLQTTQLYLPVAQTPQGPPFSNPIVFPAPHQLALPGSLISADFNVELIAETVTEQTFVVHGTQSGWVTGTFQVTGESIELSMSHPFHPGEWGQGVVTTDTLGRLGASAISPPHPFVWQFGVSPSTGSGYLVPHSTTPAFGVEDSQDVALGDLDEDGDVDALIANETAPNTVWLNDGLGNFSPHPTTPIVGTGGGQAVALGDVDNDGDLDGVFANDGGLPQTVWLNDGQGNLTPHPTGPEFGSGSGKGLAFGELNGDGWLDVVVANAADEPETVWLNDGTGAFIAHPTTPGFGAGNSSDVALSDLDGDFDVDAVVANGLGQPETVWLNDGLGNFGPHPILPAFGDGNSQALVLGDLDQDGDPDGMIANGEQEPETVWLNDGTGMFTPHTMTPTLGTGQSTDLVLGDVDADGDLDAVVANDLDEPETVWLNDGAGAFTALPGVVSFGAHNSQALAIGDLDGDGGLDVVVANDAHAASPNDMEAETVWLNDVFELVTTFPDGNGAVIARDGVIRATFEGAVDPTSVNSSTVVVHGAWTGQLTGVITFLGPDQFQFASDTPFLPGEDVMMTLTSGIHALNGMPLKPFAWSFRAATTGGSGDFVLHPAGAPFSGALFYLGDLDRDGDLDVINSKFSVDYGDGVAEVLLNNGEGSFLPHASVPIFGPGWVRALGDLDGDGDLDAVLTNLEFVRTEIWENDGTGAFHVAGYLPGDSAFGVYGWNVFIGDLDVDGDLDVSAFVSTEQITMFVEYLNMGALVFGGQHEFLIEDAVILEDQFADVDNDGDVDMIARDINGFYFSVFLNNGKGVFDFLSSFGGGVFYATGVRGDMDGDHDLDWIASQYSPSEVVWLNDGSGLFSPHPIPPNLTTSVNRNVLGDVDGDEDLDVFLNSSGYPTVEMPEFWMNDGSGSLNSLASLLDDVSRNVIAVGDVDGDGDLDVFVEVVGEYPYLTEIWLNQP